MPSVIVPVLISGSDKSVYVYEQRATVSLILGALHSEQSGLRAPVVRLRLAHHAWRSAVARAPALRRELYFAQRHWFTRWCSVGQQPAGAAHRRIEAVAAARKRRQQRLAQQWLARAYAMCVFTRVQSGSARAMALRKLARWVFSVWVPLLVAAQQRRVGASASMARLIRAQVWAHWNGQAQRCIGLRRQLKAWQEVAWASLLAMAAPQDKARLICQRIIYSRSTTTSL